MAVATPTPRGRNPYAHPATPGKPFDLSGPNTFTADQLEAFFANVPEQNVRDALVEDILSQPTMEQALFGMMTGLGGPWSKFATDIPFPVSDFIGPPSAYPPAPSTQGGGGGGGMPRKMLV